MRYFVIIIKNIRNMCVVIQNNDKLIYKYSDLSTNRQNVSQYGRMSVSLCGLLTN